MAHLGPRTKLGSRKLSELSKNMGTNISANILKLYKSMHKIEKLMRGMVNDTLGQPHRKETQMKV